LRFRTKQQNDELDERIRDFVRQTLNERRRREEERRRASRERPRQDDYDYPHDGYDDASEEEDYWPFDEDQRLPKEMDFPFPEEGINNPSSELPELPEPSNGDQRTNDEQTESGDETDREEEREVVVDAVATYKNMRSPGLIQFYMGNVLFDFWFHVVRLSQSGKYSLTISKVKMLAEIYLHSVLYHELFHYFCDVQSYISGDLTRSASAPPGYRSSPKEEPLAVAFSRWRVGEEHKISTHVEAFIDSSFNYEKVPWYRNWINFKGDVVLTKGIYDYIPYDDLGALMKRGVDAPALLFKSIGAVIEAPNAALILWWPEP